MLQDDPAFVPGLAYLELPIDFENMDLSITNDHGDLISTPVNSRTISIHNAISVGSERNIIIPSSSSRGDIFQPFDEFDFPKEDDQLFLNPDFEFDENGNIRDIIPKMNDTPLLPLNSDMNNQISPKAGTSKARRTQLSETADSELVLKDHEEAFHNFPVMMLLF